ncbi:DUF2157 domain-containing protein [Shewanella psychrotolerans]|uniref:DUF2157 domain-containing protein n=1 Tax=Shewanella psychrotolerans TaxID=2864206 RepID=UPI001C66176D|nr:DUF2157 domain-containing protein [Shewanella psychrotolerans]QYJ99835.1 DUF2157 domain-containing protein [Shewanella psychrotolerans]
MSNLREQVWRWYEQGKIAAEEMPKALKLAGQSQADVEWQQKIEQLLLWLGVLLLAAGVIIFLAFNWQDFGKFGKFALVQALLLICSFSYTWFRWQERDSLVDGLGATKANSALLGLSFMIGALLALVGQTYQTGADPWQLFAIWSLCLLPLAWLSGFDLLWLKLLLLLNVSVVLYFSTWPQALWWFGFDIFPLVVISVCNGLSYLFFYGATALGLTRCNAPITQALTMVTALSALTWYGCWQAADMTNKASFTFYWLYALTVFILSRFVLQQLFPLALVCFSVIAVSTVWLATKLFVGANNGVYMFLLLSLYVIGVTTMASVWLTKARGLFHGAQADQEA